MSLEPEKPIESLLRRYARKRRERAGDSWDLHPATRRLFQQEVARRFAQKRKTSGSWLHRLIPQEWLRPIAATAGIAVLILTAWVFLAGEGSRATKSISSAAGPTGSATSGVVQFAGNDKAATF